MSLQRVKSIDELPATNPDKRSPNPALAVCESVPKSCQTFLLSATMLLAPLNRILILNLRPILGLLVMRQKNSISVFC